MSGTQNLYVVNNFPGMTGTNSWEPINPGYRLAQTGKTFPGHNMSPVPTGVTEKDCQEHCRAATGRVEHSHWSRSLEILCSNWSRSVEIPCSHWSRSVEILCSHWWNLTMLVPRSMP